MKMPTLKYMLFALTLVTTSCSLVEVQNPNVTEDSFLGTPESSSIWLNGLRKQFAQTLNQTIVFAEMVSDNYYNNSSLSNQVFDIPMLIPEDLDIDNVQREIARLRNMAIYGLGSVIPADRDADVNQAAEMHFFLAYANLLSGELFASLPMEEGGAALPAAAHLANAITELQAAISLTNQTARKAEYELVLARAYYASGQRQEADRVARNIINTTPLLLRNAIFDGQNGASNLMQSYTYSSSTNTLAPLPRLDFLDPKYFHVGDISLGQKPIAIAKSEEAYLIAAEAALGNGELNEAKQLFSRLLREVIAQRPTSMVDGKNSLRRGTRSDYPLSSATRVRFTPDGPLKDNLVLARGAGNIKVFQVSGTSLQQSDIEQAQSADDLTYMLCLLRQEIFMSEGRRMTDLGIRFPVSRIEQQNNPNITTADLQATIPSYIPLEAAMDDFDYQQQEGIVTIKYDMNRILVENKQTTGILPLLK